MAPDTVTLLLEQGLGDLRPLGEILALATIRTLEVRARVAAYGARIERALLQRMDPGELATTKRIVDATLAGIVRRERSVRLLASRVFMSRSTLERSMRSAGLVPPSTFLIRTRLIVGTLLRADPMRRARAWDTPGFYSSGHLSNQFRAHFGRTLMEMNGRRSDEIASELVGGLLARDSGAGG